MENWFSYVKGVRIILRGDFVVCVYILDLIDYFIFNIDKEYFSLWGYYRIIENDR